VVCLEDIESQLVESSHILSGMANADTGIILLEDDIQDPMEAISHRPMVMGGVNQGSAGRLLM